MLLVVLKRVDDRNTELEETIDFLRKRNSEIPIPAPIIPKND